MRLPGMEAVRSVHQLAIASNGLRRVCNWTMLALDPNSTAAACDGEEEEVHGELPERGPIELGVEMRPVAG